MLYLRFTVQEFFQASILHDFNELFRLFLVNACGVEVKLYSGVKDHRVLGNDGNLLADLVQVNFADFDAIDNDRATINFDNTS